MTAMRVVLFFFALLVVAAIGYATREGEIITLVANQNVPLLDPETLAGRIGGLPTTIAALTPGQSLPVVDCHDRKSDIDLVVSYQGRNVVAGGSFKAFTLTRRPASMREAGAINACLGLF
jgi:hypothetical protein